jgi:hypothetical protein
MSDENAKITMDIIKNYNQDDTERMRGIVEALDRKDAQTSTLQSENTQLKSQVAGLVGALEMFGAETSDWLEIDTEEGLAWKPLNFQDPVEVWRRTDEALADPTTLAKSREEQVRREERERIVGDIQCVKCRELSAIIQDNYWEGKQKGLSMALEALTQGGRGDA